MVKYCCSDFKKSLAYEKSSFSPIGSSKKWLLFVGKNKVAYKIVKNLAEAIEKEGGPKLKGSPKLKDDEIVTVPVMLPISYCPFCGKKLG